MEITKETVDLVKRFEGLELKAYRDPVGIVTIGYGYTNRAGFGPGVRMGDVWTESQADAMLREGLDRFADQIRPHIKREITENQFGAFVSLAYNIGAGAFIKSTALKRFNDGDTLGAAEAMTWWNKAGGEVLRGLVRRREAERQLFLSEPDNFAAGITPDAPRDTPAQSTTMQAAIVAMLATLGQVLEVVKGAVSQISGAFGISPEAALAIVAAAALAWVFRERLQKWARGDR